MSAGLVFSPWFLLTLGLLALFLAIEKRKAELRVSESRGAVTRKVSERHSLPLLLRLESLLATSAFMSYSLWAAGPTLKGAPTSWMLFTIPLVLVGFFAISFSVILMKPTATVLWPQTRPPKNLKKSCWVIGESNSR